MDISIVSGWQGEYSFLGQVSSDISPTLNQAGDPRILLFSLKHIFLGHRLLTRVARKRGFTGAPNGSWLGWPGPASGRYHLLNH